MAKTKAEVKTKAETESTKLILVGNRQSKTGGLLSNMKLATHQAAYYPMSPLRRNLSN